MTRIWVRKKLEVASLFRGRSLVDLESIRAQWWNELAKLVARNTELSCSRVRKQTDLSWWNRIRVVVRARDHELDLGLDWAPFGDLESIRAQWWNELAKLVARRIELSCSRVRIRRTSVGEIVYESLFVLEIVNSTSVAQKTKMIRKVGGSKDRAQLFASSHNTDLGWWNRIRVVVRARNRELDLGCPEN